MVSSRHGDPPSWLYTTDAMHCLLRVPNDFIPCIYCTDLFNLIYLPIFVHDIVIIFCLVKKPFKKYYLLIYLLYLFFTYLYLIY